MPPSSLSLGALRGCFGHLTQKGGPGNPSLLTLMLAITPATQEAEVGGLQVQGLLSLQSEFKVILGYLVLSEDPVSK